MTLNELFFDSLESVESFYIDRGRNVKQLTKDMYIALENFEVKNYYLDIKDGKPCIIVAIDD